MIYLLWLKCAVDNIVESPETLRSLFKQTTGQ
jgi:hypothetical protein